MTSLAHERIMHETEGWTRVLECLPEVKLIAWDGCHKIYLALDDEAMVPFTGKDSAYETCIKKSPAEYYKKLRKWYMGSCELRFVSGWRGDDYVPLIGQF